MTDRARPAQLACVVLSVGAPPEVADAVHSLLDQDTSCEIVLVNSGGGDPGRRLRARGVDVPVITQKDRLFPGGARNAGIAATRAPFVAFLACDCVAGAGWVRGRLRLHEGGAPLVAHVLGNLYPDSRSACAQFLFLHHRLHADVPAGQRLFFGLSYERSLFDRFGLFREDVVCGEDTEFNRRLASAGVPMAHSPEVRTLHRYTVRPGPLMVDQFKRGARTMVSLRKLGSGRPQMTAPLRNVGPAVRQARRTRDSAERARLLASAPLLAPAALATTMGNVYGWSSGPARAAAR